MNRFSSRRGKLYDLQSNRSFTPGTDEYNKVIGMFPEAAGVMQTKSTMPVAKSTRMAGDEVMDNIDVLLSEIRASDDQSNRLENLVQEARVYLPQRRQELDALAGGNRGGSRLQDAIEGEAVLANLGRLQVGQRAVPMPIIRGDKRTHTNYRTDGITGQELVVPYMNPDSPTQVLSTQMGVRPQDVDQADEMISMRALQLMGYKVDMPQNSLLADFQVTDPRGERYAIDGMQITQGKPIEMQTHSFIAPRRRDGSLMSVPETQAKLEQEIAYQGNIIDAVDNMASRGQLYKPDIARKAGKVMRGDHSGRLDNSEHEYDMLIMPEYKQSVRNSNWRTQPRNIVTPPSAISMADVPAAYDAIREGAGSNIEVVPNYGGNTNRGNRRQLDWHKVNIALDRDAKAGGDKVFIDAVKAEPLVAQLLDNESMNKLRVK